MTFTEAINHILRGNPIVNNKVEMGLIYGILVFRELNTKGWRPLVPNVDDMTSKEWTLK